METGEKNLKELVDDLRQEWKLMWRTRIEDKVRAEGIADKTFDRLFVDRGTILFATRKYKPMEFKEILDKYLSPYEAEIINPDPARGGIRKFIREYISIHKKIERKRILAELDKMKQYQQHKHGGRGWLHLSWDRTL